MNSYEPRELLKSEDDYTEALEKVKLIHEILKGKSEFLLEQRVIALYGDWGSGKSSVVKTLMSKNSEYNLISDYTPILFEAWEYERDDNLSLSLFEMLLDEGEKRLNEKIRKNLVRELKTIYSVLKGAAKGFSITLPLNLEKPNEGELSVNTEKIFNEIDKVNNEYSRRSYHTDRKKLKENFAEIIKRLKIDDKKLLIFIDDLDRCENENIIDLITSIKHLFTLSDDIIFLVTIDKNAVSQALEVKYGKESEKAEEYLEKVFPLNFSLGTKLNYDKYFNELNIEKLRLNNNRKDMTIRSSLKRFFIKYGVTTPRKFIRILNKVKLLESFLNVKEVNDEEYIAFIYLNAFSLFVMAEYNRSHYNNFFEQLRYPKVNKPYRVTYIEAFKVDKTKEALANNPIYMYFHEFGRRFSDKMFLDFKEILKIIENLV